MRETFFSGMHFSETLFFSGMQFSDTIWFSSTYFQTHTIYIFFFEKNQFNFVIELMGQKTFDIMTNGHDYLT